MDTRVQDRELIEKVLLQQTLIPYSRGQIAFEPIFDRKTDRYLIMLVGWEGVRRVHGALVHIDLIDGKFWIQRDGTEHGIAHDLMAAGIPPKRIVLAFHHEYLRQDTEFAAA